MSCPNAGTTSLSGHVYAPNGVDPVPGARVYVPNGTVQPFAVGVADDDCQSQVSGSPLVSTSTGPDGTFTLSNVPVGSQIPLVIQLGRWRRQVVVPSVVACQDNPLPAAVTRLPRNHLEGDIPHIAVVTGSTDAVECVLRKMGIDDSEFTSDSGGGRINLFLGAYFAGASAGASTQTEDHLWGTQASLDAYDAVIFACQGNVQNLDPAAQQRLIQFTNVGGRALASHYGLSWLYNDAPFSSTADWNVDQSDITSDPQTGYVDTSFPEGQAFAQWLQAVGASTTAGQVALYSLRHDLNGVAPPSRTWLTLSDPNSGPMVMDFTFRTPVGSPAAQQEGRVEFQDFHAEPGSFSGTVFPAECNTHAGATAVDKVLEYRIFQLTSCVDPAGAT